MQELRKMLENVTEEIGFSDRQLKCIVGRINELTPLQQAVITKIIIKLYEGNMGKTEESIPRGSVREMNRSSRAQRRPARSLAG